MDNVRTLKTIIFCKWIKNDDVVWSLIHTSCRFLTLYICNEILFIFRKKKKWKEIVTYLLTFIYPHIHIIFVIHWSISTPTKNLFSLVWFTLVYAHCHSSRFVPRAVFEVAGYLWLDVLEVDINVGYCKHLTVRISIRRQLGLQLLESEEGLSVVVVTRVPRRQRKASLLILGVFRIENASALNEVLC